MVPAPPLGRHEHQREHNQRRCNHQRAAQCRLGKTRKRRTRDQRRDGSQDQQQQQLRLRVLPVSAHQSNAPLRELKPLGPEVQQQRDERSQMQRHVEAQPRIFPAEKPRCQRQVRRTGNRQKFGDALYGSQDDRLK